MTWAALIVGILFATGSMGLLGYIALKLFRSSAEIARATSVAHQRTLEFLEHIHDRNMDQLSQMADRFMALDFATFKNYQLAEAAEFGGLEEPEVAVEAYTPSGAVIPIGDEVRRRLEAAANEEKLLAEDFGEGWDEGEGNR